MGQVAVTINGREYPVACDDGQEEHVNRLAAYIDKRMADIVSSVGQVGDARLLVMVSLLVADELSEAYDELERARKASGEARAAGKAAALAELEGELAPALEKLAGRIEDIAARLESD